MGAKNFGGRVNINSASHSNIQRQIDAENAEKLKNIKYVKEVVEENKQYNLFKNTELKEFIHRENVNWETINCDDFDKYSSAAQREILHLYERELKYRKEYNKKTMTGYHLLETKPLEFSETLEECLKQKSKQQKERDAEADRLFWEMIAREQEKAATEAAAKAEAAEAGEGVSGGGRYRKTKRNKSLCRRKSVKRLNKCKKVRGCKVAKGKKRTYCRKAHNKRRRSSRRR
jgi:hypothetical protein